MLTIIANFPKGLRINITGGESNNTKDIDRIFEILYPKASLLELSTTGFNTERIVSIARISQYSHTSLKV